MPDTHVLEHPTAEAGMDPAEGWPCSWEDCPKRAVIAMRFRNQPGHVHECHAHAAELREWCDVIETAPLPCPFDHGDGITWTDDPTPLDDADCDPDWNDEPPRITDLPDISTWSDQ